VLYAALAATGVPIWTETTAGPAAWVPGEWAVMAAEVPGPSAEAALLPDRRTRLLIEAYRYRKYEHPSSSRSPELILEHLRIVHDDATTTLEQVRAYLLATPRRGSAVPEFFPPPA
jgi:hypothetical protein